MGNIITTAFEKVLGRQPSHHLADNTADVALYEVEAEMVWKQHIQPVPECTYYSDYHSDHNDGSEIH